MNFLGHLFKKYVIRPLDEKILATEIYPEPDSLSKLRRFFAKNNFYRRFTLHTDFNGSVRKKSRKVHLIFQGEECNLRC